MWSSTAGAAAVKPSTNAAPVHPAVAFSRGVIQKCQDISHELCSCSLWIYLWGIVVTQSNVWSCEELSSWKSSLVLSICARTFTVSFTKGSHQLLRALQYDCWSSFSCIFFLLFESFLESLEGWLVRMSISWMQGQLFCENILSFELSCSCLFQYFICLGLSCSWCWLGLPFWVWRKLSMFIWEALLMPLKTFPD